MTRRYYGADVPRSTGPHPDPMTDTTTRTDTLLALADRVESGEHTFELEREIGAAAEPEYGDPPRRYLSSVDAVEALRVKTLPLSRWASLKHQLANGQWVMQAVLFSQDGARPVTEIATAPTEPAARLAALLRALAVSEEVDRGCDTLGPDDRILIAYLDSRDIGDARTPAGIAKDVGEPEMIVRRRLRRFARDKLVKRLTGPAPGRYRITEAGRRALQGDPT